MAAMWPSSGLGRLRRDSLQAKGLGYAGLYLPAAVLRDTVSGRIEATSSALRGDALFGPAGYFGGGGTRYTELTPFDQQYGNGKTWALWVQLVTAGASYDNQAVLTFGNTAGSAYGPYITVGGGTLNCYMPGVGWVSGGTVTVGRVHHVVAMIGLTSTVLYLDGVAVQTTAAAGVLGTPDKCFIGARVDSGSFDGYIQDVRRYDRELSAAMIATLYHPTTRGDLYAPLPSVRRYLFLGDTGGAVTYDTFRPSGTLSAGTWAPYPSGTLYGVTSDEDDATYAESSTGSGTDTLDLSFPAMSTPPAGTVTFYLRHAAGSDEDDITGSGDLAAPGGTGEGTGTVT